MFARRFGRAVVVAAADYYSTLGVPKSANRKEIKAAYRKLARQFHTDVNKEPGATEKFKEISAAYEETLDHPRGPADLMALPSPIRADTRAVDMIDALCSTHKATHDQLVVSTLEYKAAADRTRRHLEFEPGDYVWAVLTRDRYPAHEYSKLAAQKIGPLEVLAKINPNAYRLKLSSHVRTSDVFNVKHLIPYTRDNNDDVDDAFGSRANLLSAGENDVGIKLLKYLEDYDRMFKPKT